MRRDTANDAVGSVGCPRCIVLGGTVDGGPMEGVPKAGVVTGVVVDVPPMVPTKKGVEGMPAMGLVGVV